MAVADHVGADLTGCYASTETLADEACVSKRTAQRHLDALTADGVIRLGDQSRTEHLRADRRPVVWDLGTGRQAVTPSDRVKRTGRQSDTPSNQASSTGRHAVTPHANGVTACPPRGDSLSRTGCHADAQTGNEPKEKNQSQSQHLSVSSADLGSAELSESDPGDREREVSYRLAGLDREALEGITLRLHQSHREPLVREIKSAATEAGVTFIRSPVTLGDLSDDVLRRGLLLALLSPDGPGAVGELIV